jgi:hypothetical protein
MKKISVPAFIILMVIIASCRGPLAKPGDSGMKESKTADSHMQAAKSSKEEVIIEPAEGGISIGNLFSDMKNYSGKEVRIRGKVTKVNPSIMNTNWIHIQDGTGTEDSYDLTVTSSGLPDVGSIITVEGKISLNKDFGHGYKYDIIMEDARIIP